MQNGECYGNKLSLPVPPPGILRTSSPHSSSSPSSGHDRDDGPGHDRDPASDLSQSPRPCYSARSDTVLEMCSDIEDISFIDEDEEEEQEEHTSARHSPHIANIIITATLNSK